MKNTLTFFSRLSSAVIGLVLCSSPVFSTSVLDRSFGIDGIATTTVGDQATARNLVIQPDEKIVVVGDLRSANNGRDIFVTRNNADGTLDTEFGSNGTVTITASSLDEAANGLALQADGKIVIVGSSWVGSAADGLLARLTPDGQLDPTFGNSGIVTVHLADYTYLNAVAIQTDGQILAAGKKILTPNPYPSSVATLLRFTTSGILDTTFATGGVFVQDFPNYFSEAFEALKILPNGRILTGGRTDSFPNMPINLADFMLELLPNGTIASDFGDQGMIFLSMQLYPGLPISTSFDLAVFPNGDIIMLTAFRRRYSSAGIGVSGGVGGSSVAVRSDGAFYVLNVRPDYLLTPYNIAPMFVPGVPIAFYSPTEHFVGGGQTNGRRVAFQTDQRLIILSDATTGFTLAAVRLITSHATPSPDFDNDFFADIAVLRPSEQTAYALATSGGVMTFATGEPGFRVRRVIPEFFGPDMPYPLTYFSGSDVVGDPALFCSVNRYRSRVCQQWGRIGDVPVGGDYNGDRFTDISVFRPSGGTWYFRDIFGQIHGVQWGTDGDKPVPADYDYDGITDFAVYRPSTGTWWVRRSSDGSYFAFQFGISSDIPLTGDFDGDGYADFTVYRPQEGIWYQYFTTEGFRAMQFGLSTDLPVPGDYDGDGRHDIAVYRDGIWYMLQSTAGFRGAQWGAPGDVPVAVRYDQ